MIENIRKELKDLADSNYAKFNKKSCPDTNKKILGVRIPELRKLAKKIVKECDWKKYLLFSDDSCFEEVVLQGFVIGYAKIDIEEKFEYIKEFISKIDSWAITDTFCPTLKIKEKDLPKVWDFILQYLESSREFEIRFVVIMMLDYYLNDEYVDDVIKKLDNISHDGYYVKMAIAWCLAEVGVKYNDKLIHYIKGNNNLDKFTYNKTLQKMRESYRINDKQKKELQKMKRK